MRIPSHMKSRQLHQEGDEFLTANETTLSEQGIRFHQAKPVFNQPAEIDQGLNLLPDLEERLHLARRAQISIRSQHTKEYDVKDYAFNLVQLSSFVFSDLDFLRLISRTEGYFQYRRLTSTEALLAICTYNIPEAVSCSLDVNCTNKLPSSSSTRFQNASFHNSFIEAPNANLTPK